MSDRYFRIWVDVYEGRNCLFSYMSDEEKPIAIGDYINANNQNYKIVEVTPVQDRKRKVFIEKEF